MGADGGIAATRSNPPAASQTAVYRNVRFDRTELASPPWHDDVVTLSADFSATPDRQHGAEIQRLCDAMEAADQAGRYPQLTVERPWSVHNPVLEGEFASPKAIRWYLERELSRLAASGARISVGPGREALDLFFAHGISLGEPAGSADV